MVTRQVIKWKQWWQLSHIKLLLSKAENAGVIYVANTLSLPRAAWIHIFYTLPQIFKFETVKSLTADNKTVTNQKG